MSANSKLIAIVPTQPPIHLSPQRGKGRSSPPPPGEGLGEGWRRNATVPLLRYGTQSVPRCVSTETVGTMRSILFAALCCVATAAFATPNIQHWQSASGAKVLFVENHDLPMLDVSVSIPAGSSFDIADKSGVAGLTHHLLDLGAEGVSEDDIARGMADIGAQFGGGFDQDMASVSLRTLSSTA